MDWDGRDGAGHPVVNGVYYARLRAGALTRSVPVTVLR
jgi:hypothetical protein